MPTNPPALFQDKLLRRIVVGSTGLGIALMLASVAAVQFGKAQSLQFAWHWSIAVVMFLGAFWNYRFWNLIWKAYDTPTSNLRRSITFAFAALLALGLATFLYPIRFISAEYHLAISRGLLTAVVFLGTMGWLIFKLGRGFIQADEVETAQHG
jgi:hypothetical protein